MYAGDEFHGDDITSPTMRPNTIRPLAREDEHPNNWLHARLVSISTPEGRRYIAQVNLNGNWQDVVDYHGVGLLNQTKREARTQAKQALRTISLQWEN